MIRHQLPKVLELLPRWLPFRQRIAAHIAWKLLAQGNRIVRYNNFAVIYDEVDPETAPEMKECFYEAFGSPEEARRMYTEAFGNEYYNPRVVLILGPVTADPQGELL